VGSLSDQKDRVRGCQWIERDGRLLTEDRDEQRPFANNLTKPSQSPQDSEKGTVASAFKPFGEIALFNYLTTNSPRVDWGREIMRVFLKRSREYRYQLTAQEVLESVRASFDPDYTLEDCRGDLDRLVGWSNLATLHDTSRVTSIADFRSPVLRYQATSGAIEIEAFLSEHARVGASEGGLHQGDLPRLWEALEQLDRWLREDPRTRTPERRLAIAEQWRDAFSIWEKVTNDAAQYLGSMNRSAQQAVSLETYLAYKSIVVTYVQSFAQQLTLYSQRISGLLDEWKQIAVRAVLLEILASSPPPLQPLAESVEARQAWLEDVRHQVEALEQWFINDNNAELFRRAAHDAIEKVVHRAHALAAAMRPHTDYVTQLQNLATQFQALDDLETAQQLFASAFANTLPIHLSEGMSGSPSAADDPGARKTWLAPPTVIRNIRPINKGTSERVAEQPMRTDRDALANLRAQYEAELTARRRRFARLFSSPLLDLATLKSITPEERALLTEILDACLSNPDHEYVAQDGSIIRLLNSDEQQFAALQASDGILILPRYRLQRGLLAEEQTNIGNLSISTNSRNGRGSSN
jgi:uncharacterized protein (TIGR02677 family)